MSMHLPRRSTRLLPRTIGRGNFTEFSPTHSPAAERSCPHHMEVRRWGGSQTCSVDETDRQHQFENCVGGLWAESGRPPNAFLGVGFAGFGMGPAMTFERTPESYSDEWSWAFGGVDGPTFGSEGLNVGAGNEFDSFEASLTSLGRSTVLASALPDGPNAFGVYEAGGGRAPDPRIRADMVATLTNGGGMVFSTSSITASGCLVVEGVDARLRRICSNVLQRMIANYSDPNSV